MSRRKLRLKFLFSFFFYTTIKNNQFGKRVFCWKVLAIKPNGSGCMKVPFSSHRKQTCHLCHKTAFCKLCMSHILFCFSPGLGSAGLTVGLGGLKGLLQPKPFCDFYSWAVLRTLNNSISRFFTVDNYTHNMKLSLMRKPSGWIYYSISKWPFFHLIFNLYFHTVSNNSHHLPELCVRGK